MMPSMLGLTEKPTWACGSPGICWAIRRSFADNGTVPNCRESAKGYAMPRDTKATKSVGEFWACCKLAMNGWAPALTRDGLERTDILAERNADKSLKPGEVSLISVQVKTSRNERWPLNVDRIGAQRNDAEWFVLVGWADKTQELSSYVVPRDHVCAAAWLYHMAWLRAPGFEAKRHCPPSQARVDGEVFTGYKDQWALLLKSTSSVPILLPHWLHEVALRQECALPEWHPWSKKLPNW